MYVLCIFGIIQKYSDDYNSLEQHITSNFMDFKTYSSFPGNSIYLFICLFVLIDCQEFMQVAEMCNNNTNSSNVKLYREMWVKRYVSNGFAL